MGRGSHSLGKRRREAEKQRKKREKGERARQRKADGGGVEIASVEDLQPAAVNATVESVMESGRTVIVGEEQGVASSGPPVRLFVGGLSFDTNAEELKAAFETVGPVVDALIVHDRDTGDPRGFGFVTMGDRKSASKALRELGGSELHGRNIRVDMATER